MKYMDYIKKILENTTVGYDGVFGNEQIGIGTHGGSIGNGDWYAPGDARNVYGLNLNKKGKKKKRKQKMHLYRRAFMESLDTSDELILEGAIFCVEEYRDLALKILEKNGIEYNIDDDNVIYMQGTDNELQNIVENIITIAGDKFEDNYLILIGEMLVNFKKPKKQESEYNQGQLRQGAKVEAEHIRGKVDTSTERKVVKNIAKNHLDEDPHYYAKLRRMEHPRQEKLKKK